MRRWPPLCRPWRIRYCGRRSKDTYTVSYTHANKHTSQILQYSDIHQGSYFHGGKLVGTANDGMCFLVGCATDDRAGYGDTDVGVL